MLPVHATIMMGLMLHWIVHGGCALTEIGGGVLEPIIGPFVSSEGKNLLIWFITVCLTLVSLSRMYGIIFQKKHVFRKNPEWEYVYL